MNRKPAGQITWRDVHAMPDSSAALNAEFVPSTLASAFKLFSLQLSGTRTAEVLDLCAHADPGRRAASTAMARSFSFYGSSKRR
jgi:hypothetical protein